MDNDHALSAEHAVVVYEDQRQCADQPIVEPRLRTRKEAAQFLKVSLNTLDRLRYQRALPFYRIGGSIRFGLWDLIEFVRGKPVFPEQFIPDAQRTLTKRELARFLCVSVRTVEVLNRNRGLWRRHIGRTVRFLLADVLHQLASDFRVDSRAPASKMNIAAL
jgi:excisionase family DNA binding protein